jgi:hypothetical protein
MADLTARGLASWYVNSELKICSTNPSYTSFRQAYISGILLEEVRKIAKTFWRYC